MNPTISIVVPCFNGQAYQPRLAESLTALHD
jgi:hypothetical protein